jgi:glycerate 2-kinase
VVSASSIARAIAEEAVASIDLGARVRDGLPRLPPPRARVTVVAVGKAAPVMARGALDRWGERIDRVLVVTTDETDVSSLSLQARVTILRAAHPLPDEGSVEAANQVLQACVGGAGDLCLALVSGGASSLLCAPVAGLSLHDKRALVAELLGAGAPIADVNVVRRHLSRIKGGGLARAALPGRTLTLIASDVMVSEGEQVVVGGPFHVGSGPSVPDPTTVDDARRALERWAPTWWPRVGPLLTTGLGADEEGARRTRVKTVATPLDLAEAALSAARQRGFHTLHLQATLDPVETIARRYVSFAATMVKHSVAVAVGEPSVTLPRRPGGVGRGGRAGRLALSVWCQGLPDDTGFASIASDGVDGSSSLSGAAVLAKLSPELVGAGVHALERFDDAPFLEEQGVSCPARPTGINLLDLHVLVRT